MLLEEIGACLQQQGIAAFEFDVPDFLIKTLATARDGNDDRIVAASKTDIADALAGKRPLTRDNGLDQATARSGAVEFEHLFCGGNQPMDLLKFDHRIDDTDEQKPVAGLKRFLR